jgi:hypothetical protein
MNIFILDNDIKLSAQYHVNRHIVKMPLETAQILCTTNHLCGNGLAPYKPAYENHPCTIWTRKSLFNYKWLIDFGIELCKEYTFRYGKIHSCQEVIRWCKRNLPNINDIGPTPFAQAMPEQYKTDDAIKAYRNYYLNEKKHLFNWKNRPIPYWIKEERIV